MKKIIVLITVIIMGLVVFNGCSKDGVVLSKYLDGKKEYTIKVGDVKKEVLNYVIYDPMIAGNSTWHKDYLFDRYIFPDIAFFVESAKGLTNQPEFISKMDLQYKKQYLTRLFQIGQENINKKAKNSKFEVVRVSHILLTINKFTNINGETKELNTNDYQKLLSEKENKAMNIIDSLKSSKNILSDFSNAAVSQSDDGSSSHVGGDVGYFVRGSMVKEFEEASFDAKVKGLIDKPVKSSYGYHIIYVTVPSQQKNMDEIEKIMGKDGYKRIEPYIQNNFNEADRKNTYKEFYTVDLSNNNVQIEGKNYIIDQIPPDSKLFSIYGKPYTWKDSKEIISYFIPGFTNGINSTNFNDQMGNLKNFIHPVEAAKNDNTEKSQSFIKELSSFRNKLCKDLASQEFEKDFVDNGKSKITPEAVQNYYNSMKSTLVKDVKGKSIQMTLKEADGKIRDELLKQNLRQAYQEWKEQIKSKYKVVYLDNGLQALKELETAQLKLQQKNADKTKKQNVPPQKK